MTFPWWSLLPFAAMLANIAVLPILPATTHWQEKCSSQLLVALILGIPTSVYMWIKAGNGALIATGVEYVQFTTLLLSLFVISGGIHLEGNVQAVPRNNVIFLAIGGLLASFTGTAGAAMLLIRPLLATNKEREHRVHTVLFTIFIVANCGGLLTLLGDPPLFLGFLHGVPFTWTLGLWKEWLFVLVPLLGIYYSIDSIRYATESKATIERDVIEATPLKLCRIFDPLFFVIVIVPVTFIPSWDGELLATGEAHGVQLVPWRELVILMAVAASYFFGDKIVCSEENALTWAPIAEVAALFIGISSTMTPTLRYLGQVAPSFPLNRITFFLFSDLLSSVLDNALTYMTSFEMTRALGGDGVLIVGVSEYYLVPISPGAVLCGAITYIGNGPNFMVKSMADADGMTMPNFGACVVKAFEYLIPTLTAMVLLFLAESLLAHLLGFVIAVLLIIFAVLRIPRARKILTKSETSTS